MRYMYKTKKKRSDDDEEEEKKNIEKSKEKEIFSKMAISRRTEKSLCV